MSTTRTTLRTTGVAVRAMLVFTLVLGVGYTALVTAIGQLALPWQANGSPVHTADGDPVGSALIGQPFTGADGEAIAGYFQSRPSAAGAGYDGAASSGSNLGPENADLIAAIAERRATIAEREGIAESEIPPDAVTASGSGVDPHISVANARLQAPRVAEVRGVALDTVLELVDDHTAGRSLGFLGERGVNVLELNLALDGLDG